MVVKHLLWVLENFSFTKSDQEKRHSDLYSIGNMCLKHAIFHRLYIMIGSLRVKGGNANITC